jgi:TIR domain
VCSRFEWRVGYAVADIFISYSKEHTQPTRDVADYLTREGYSVWWDTNRTAGERFRDVIDRELDAAKVVIMIRTAHSVASKWVLAEADHADQHAPLCAPVAGHGATVGQRGYRAVWATRCRENDRKKPSDMFIAVGGCRISDDPLTMLKSASVRLPAR